MVIVMGSRVKAVTRIAWLSETYDFGSLVMVSREKKSVCNLLQSYLVCICRGVLRNKV